MFKRMGLGIAYFLLIFLVLAMYMIISTEDFMNSGNNFVHCNNNSIESSDIPSSANRVHFICRL